MNTWSADIGRRVGYWRRRRGLTRKQLADLVGRSVSWLDKVESGERSLLRLPMIDKVAEALGVDVAVLTESGPARRARQCPDPMEVARIRPALGTYDVGVATPDPGLESFRSQVDYACAAWLGSHFGTLGGPCPTSSPGPNSSPYGQLTRKRLDAW